MSEVLYMTTLDGNKGHGDIQDIRELRSEIIFQLLFWDEVCVADSQFLTNKNFSTLILDGEESDNEFKAKWIDGSFCLCDLDELVKEGWVRCACREDSKLTSVGAEMRQRFVDSDRVLSETATKKLAKIIETNYIHFDLNKVAGLFKRNLEKTFEISNGFKGLPGALKSQIKAEMKHEMVSFDALENMIRETVAEGLIETRTGKRLYDLVKSCYIPNVPQSLGMHFLFQSRFTPILLCPESEDTVCSNGSAVKPMRFCCVLNGSFAQQLPMKSFAQIRKMAFCHFANDMSQIRKYLSGEIAWNDNHALECFNAYIDELNQYAYTELKQISTRDKVEQLRKTVEKRNSYFKRMAWLLGAGTGVGLTLLFMPVEPAVATAISALIVPYADYMANLTQSWQSGYVHIGSKKALGAYYARVNQILRNENVELIMKGVEYDRGVV